MYSLMDLHEDSGTESNVDYDSLAQEVSEEKNTTYMA